ncbi:adenine phosphoribosyltransferase [Limimonas halophila]|uniref:Adenine phosphoribosyltransferase n=1 Tax=Limimonas halophila TaxID=1082479 RepID=A0A1G7PSR4_9PROT|nr:adenine phosphoribosyltransferase [Limimonas halophila]SDF89316.1 adenine phosphoribosyltransferase [Limimonas halophila]
MDLKDHIRRVPDFPKPGILFYDISTLLAHPDAWQETVRQLEAGVAPHKPDVLAGIESRGFLVAAPLALRLNLGFVMLRKPGKLPGPTVRHSYALEYGEDAIEMQEDAVTPGQRVVVLDDLLATGGTMRAATDLLHEQGAEVPSAACLIELSFLQGRDKMNVPVHSLMSFASGDTASLGPDAG